MTALDTRNESNRNFAGTGNDHGFAQGKEGRRCRTSARDAAGVVVAGNGDGRGLDVGV